MRYILIALLIVALVSGAALAGTFTVGAEIDDASANVGAGATNSNTVADATIAFGRLSFGEQIGVWAYMRWAIGPSIPRASKAGASHVTLDASASYSVAFNTTITGLNPVGSPAWREVGANGGFHTDNYANGSALNAISRASTNVTWTAVAAQTAGSPYDTPSITTIIQELIDSPYYESLTDEGKYIGIVIDDGNGAYTWPPPLRSEDSFTGNGAELDVTFEPWGEVYSGNGYKYDSVCDCMKYFNY